MNDATAKTAAARDYRSTVFLPATPFPMRGELPKREPELLARWQRMGLYQRLRDAAKDRPAFVLHDGPPYANGPLHIGHALNKILKDVINRAAQMSGFNADYIPGWDCHGLPIEWKVEEEYRARKQDKDQVPVLEFRAECRAYAQKWLEFQRGEFKRLGVEGDWDKPYATMDLRSEALIMAEIGRFLMNGSLYRGLRPVMWSPVEKTALAEAEIEYADHVSHTLWARFRVKSVIHSGEARDPYGLQNASIIAWTTTPWTIPSNRAIAANPEIEYAVVHVTGVKEGSLLVVGEHIIIALSRLPDFAEAAGMTAHTVSRTVPGRDIVGATCLHPFHGLFPSEDIYEVARRVLAADFVTDDAGTGFVHIAPDHGEDDFKLGRAERLSTVEGVQDDGTFAAKMPGVAGLHVFKAHDRVYELCQQAGTLAAKGKITHSYPHSWRSKKPVIFRATPQWFIAMDDHNRIREKSLAAIDATHFVPDVGRNRIGGMVAARPDWCISRQRAWGVPIAVFVDKKTGEPLRDQVVLDRIVDAFTAEGADAWYKPGAAARFLGEGRDPADYEQVMDIVDVWFESGSTHAFVLPQRNLPFPADLYLEGSDQHRGWFHSSLLEAVGTRGVAPFKAILTHGFVLDEQGRKMSKSLGNTTEPQAVLKDYGADILRLWVMNSDTAQDLRIGPAILKQQAELYRRIRNTLRWVLGGLDGFAEAEKLPYAELPELERWVLHRLSELDARVREAVRTHDWNGVIPELHGFCNNDLSAFYFDVRKDALYCDAQFAAASRGDAAAGGARRRAVRTVLDVLHRCLTTWFAPVLCFTAEEAWLARFPGDDSSVHLELFPTIPAEWRDATLAAKWERIRAIRREVTTVLEQARASGEIGASLQAAPSLNLPAEDAALLPAEAWAELCITSGITLSTADTLAVGFARAPGTKCERCWKVLPEVSADTGLCRRCDAVVNA